MDEGMPTIILTVTITLIILGVGFFAFFFVITTTSDEMNIERTETFTVTDPSTDETFLLSTYPDEATITVTQYNGSAWSTVDPSHITISNRRVTIAAAGMFG